MPIIIAFAVVKEKQTSIDISKTLLEKHPCNIGSITMIFAIAGMKLMKWNIHEHANLLLVPTTVFTKNISLISKKIFGQFNKHPFTLHHKVLFMNRSKEESGQELQLIKDMMERSSRFISLSGWSGVSAGSCALVGAFFANQVIVQSPSRRVGKADIYVDIASDQPLDLMSFFGNRLLHIAILTFIAAFISSFAFTWYRSKKTNTSLWGTTSKRLFINVSVPMIAGGIYLFKLIQDGVIGYIAPGCLIFYGLALINASKFTLGEIRYLGYLQLLLGIISLWFIGNGLLFWTIGFGVLHIVYGVIMWYKYER